MVHDRLDDTDWSTLLNKNDLLIRHSWSNTQFFDLADPLHPVLLNATKNGNSCSYASPAFGDGDAASGFFVPNGLYGIDTWTFGAP